MNQRVEEGREGQVGDKESAGHSDLRASPGELSDGEE